MAYQTGLAATKAALFEELRVFLVAQGWTSYTWAEMTGTTTDTAVATGYTCWAFTNPGGKIFTFRYLETSVQIECNVATSFATGKMLTYQPGANVNRRNVLIRDVTTPLTGYHFFYDGMFVHIVMEVQANIFCHINFGMITKNGTWNGGQLITGSYWSHMSSSGVYYSLYDGIYNGYPFKAPWEDGYNGGASYGAYKSHNGFMTCDIGVSGFADLSCSDVNLVVVDTTFCNGDDSGWYRPIAQIPNLYNSRAPMFPINLVLSSAINTAASTMYQVGCVPNAAMLNITYLDPKAVVNTDWMVFPLTQKNGDNITTISSGVYGIAYKK